MIEVKIKTRDEIPKLMRKAKRANLDSLGKSGAYTRQVMKSKLTKRKKPRPPGQSVASPTKRARKSILFAVDKIDDSVVIGPSANLVGRVMSAHEFGTPYKGDKIKARPFAGPALEKATPKLAPFWRGSVSK